MGSREREDSMSLQGGYSLAESKSQSVLRTTSSRRLRFQRSYNSTTLHSYQLNKCLTVSRSKPQHKVAVFSAKAQYPLLVGIKVAVFSISVWFQATSTLYRAWSVEG